MSACSTSIQQIVRKWRLWREKSFIYNEIQEDHIGDELSSYTAFTFANLKG